MLVSARPPRRRAGDRATSAATACSRNRAARAGQTTPTRRPSSAAAGRSPASASRSSTPTTARGSAPTRSARSGSPGRTSRSGYWRNREASAALRRRDRRREPSDAGCAPAISAFSTRPASCSSPAGSRTSSSSAAPTTTRRTSSTRCETAHPALRRHGGAAFAVADDARRRAARRRAGGRAHLPPSIADPDELIGRIREAIVSEHEIVPHRDHAVAPRRPAQDHQRQDPAGANPPAVARRRAGHPLARFRLSPPEV